MKNGLSHKLILWMIQNLKRNTTSRWSLIFDDRLSRSAKFYQNSDQSFLNR